MLKCDQEIEVKFIQRNNGAFLINLAVGLHVYCLDVIFNLSKDTKVKILLFLWTNSGI